MALPMGTARTEAYEGLPNLTKLGDDAQCFPKWDTPHHHWLGPVRCQILIMIIEQITIPVG
jgi:hypothetical protein